MDGIWAVWSHFHCRGTVGASPGVEVRPEREISGYFRDTMDLDSNRAQPSCFAAVLKMDIVSSTMLTEELLAR